MNPAKDRFFYYRVHGMLYSCYSEQVCSEFVVDIAESVFGYFNGASEYPDACTERLSTRLKVFLQRGLGQFFFPQSILDCAFPNLESADARLIRLWPTPASRLKGRAGRIAMKPGRAFKLMFPFLTEAELSSLVDRYKDEFYPKEYVLKSGCDAASFRRVYTGDLDQRQNIATSYQVKHASSSCMRDTFSSLPMHPVEVYASGDFEIVWIETASGKIAARTIVCLPTESIGPIYTTSDAATACLTSHLEARNLCLDCDADAFDGARLLLRRDHGSIIAPYLDLRKEASESACGEYLVIDRRGDITCERTDGYADDSGCACYECGDRTYEDESYCCEHSGNFYCSSCYGELFTICEHCEEQTRRDDTAEVHVEDWRGRPIAQTWCQCCADNESVVTESGEDWKTEDCTEVNSGGYVPTRLVDDTHTCCDRDGEYFLHSEVRETVGGEFINIHWLEHNGWTMNESGKYFDPTDEVES